MDRSLPLTAIYTQGAPTFARRSLFFTVMQTEKFSTLDL